jgi:hypothetical protein
MERSNFDIFVPRNVKHALKPDKVNGKTVLQDAMTKEIVNMKACRHLRKMGKLPLFMVKKNHCQFCLRRGKA